MGMVGVLTFLGIWGTFIVKCLSFWKRERESNSPVAASILGCAGGVVGILAAGMFQCHYTDIEVGMLWWFIAGLAVAVMMMPPEGA